MLKQQELSNEHFNTELFLSIKVKARKFFFNERLNFESTPTVMGIMEYLRDNYPENDLPTIATVARWHSSWKRSN